MSSIRVGAQFSTFKQLTETIKEYSSLNHVEFSIQDSRKIVNSQGRARRATNANPDLVYYQLHYSCIFCAPRQIKKSLNLRKKRSSIKKDCPAFFRLTLSSDAQFLVITGCNMEHNHEKSAEQLNNLYLRRRLTLKQKRRAIKLLQSLPKRKMVQQKLMEETGKNIISKDLSNILATYRRAEFNLEDDSEEEREFVLPTLSKDNIHLNMEEFIVPEPQSEVSMDNSEDPIEWQYPTFDIALQQGPDMASCTHNFLGNSTELQINEAILNMIIKDTQPLSIVKDQGFLDLIHVLAPCYKVPSCKTLSNMLSDKYNRMMVLFKEKISSVEHLSITCETWTDTRRRNYIVITAHFCDDFELRAVTLGLYALNHSDHIYIALKLNEMCCGAWAINLDKVVAVVSDNTQSIVKATEHCFGSQRQLYCFADALVLIPSRSIAVTSDLNGLFSHIRSIVSFFEQNMNAANILERVQQEAGVSDINVLRLKRDTSTHWYSTYCMLQNFLELNDAINSILMKISSAPDMLPPVNLIVAKDVFKLFKVLKQVVVEFSRENYIICSKVIPLVKILLNKVETVQPTSQTGLTFKENILNEIQVCFGNIENIEIVAIATLMDPRFKRLHFQNSVAVGTATNKILKMLSESNNSSAEYELVQQDLPENESDEEDLWSFHKKKASHSATKENLNVLDELTTYLDQPVISISSNPFKYWDAMQNIFPNLYKLALKYLTVTATSVPAERLLTKASTINTEKRSRLSLRKLNKILFLNSNYS